MLGLPENKRVRHVAVPLQDGTREETTQRIGILDVHSNVMPQSEIARIRKCVRCSMRGEEFSLSHLIISGQRKNSEDYW